VSTPIWFVNIIKHFFPDRFWLSDLTKKIPLVRTIVDKVLFDKDDIIYLPKDHLIVVNEMIAEEEGLVLPSQVIDHFIDHAGALFLMDTCLCRTADNCQDYPHDLGCLFMGEAVNRINPKLGHRATKEEAKAHLKKCREAGLVHLIGRNKIDTMWMGIGPGYKLMTVCNCCPCCCLYKTLPNLDVTISKKITAMPGVRVHVETEECVGCESCTDHVCFVDAIKIQDGHAFISDACRTCGNCVDVCPTGAIKLTVEDDTFITQSIERLAKIVDVS
jgi:ferredoxin